MKTHEKVKSIAKETGIKFYILAERCGYSPNVFSSILNGRKPITDDVIKNLCKGLNKQPNDLIDIDSA